MTVVGADSLFSGVVVFAAEGSPWLSADATFFNDTEIFPDRTYDYRVAGVSGDEVGTFTEWVRSTPINTSLGAPPANFGLVTTEITVNIAGREKVLFPPRNLGDRGEFYVQWDTHPAAQVYEIQRVTNDPVTSRERAETHIATGNYRYFWTQAPNRLRIRARLTDANQCAGDPDNHCYSEWSGTISHNFVPQAPMVPLVEMVEPTADERVMETRENFATAVQAGIAPWGADVDAASVASFLTLGVAGIVFLLTYSVGRRRQDAGIAMGVGFGGVILALYLGWYLFGAPVAWLVGFVVLVALLTFLAVGRAFRLL